MLDFLILAPVMWVTQFLAEKYYEFVRVDERGIWTRGFFSEHLIGWDDIRKIDLADKPTVRFPPITVTSNNWYPKPVYTNMEAIKIRYLISIHLPENVPIEIVEDIYKKAPKIPLTALVTLGVMALVILLVFVWGNYQGLL